MIHTVMRSSTANTRHHTATPTTRLVRFLYLVPISHIYLTMFTNKALDVLTITPPTSRTISHEARALSRIHTLIYRQHSRTRKPHQPTPTHRHLQLDIHHHLNIQFHNPVLKAIHKQPVILRFNKHHTGCIIRHLPAHIHLVHYLCPQPMFTTPIPTSSKLLRGYNSDLLTRIVSNPAHQPCASTSTSCEEQCHAGPALVDM
ncbi:hypothetical protein HBH61_189320 [Parastagonospora nodorum]|nr:hypothetical protein HBH61_189320 [Parastagonospora nodorum]